MVSLAQRAHLTVLYNEPQRHYHTLAHIQHCLRELHSVPNETMLSLTKSLGSLGWAGIDARSVITNAIWFHDAVYDPRAASGVNEWESIDLAVGADVPASDLVVELIAATVTHRIPEGENVAKADLMGLFLDIDLSILGQDMATYNRYADQIRDEYSWVPEILYCEGRAKILTGFLEREHLYFTSHFRAKYEESARSNLECELGRLQGPTYARKSTGQSQYKGSK